MESWIIPIASVVAFTCAAYLAWRRRFGYPHPSLPGVLAYHKVTGFEMGGTWVSPRRFRSQIESLIDAGYRFIDERTYLETLDGLREGSGRDVLLTFDDGYRVLLSNAFPYLERRGIPALIFLVSSYVGRENRWELDWPGRRFRHLDWPEIRDLAGRGFAFGSHTCTHRDLTTLPPDMLRDELVRSRMEIEDRTGAPVYSLSYPFGRADAGIAREARRAGYRAAFSLCPSASREIDRFMLRREGVYVIDTRFSLKTKLSRRGLFWIEDVKGRAINGVAALTPLLKGMRG